MRGSATIMNRTVPAQRTVNDPVYLDCNATTPLDPTVQDALMHWFTAELGNAGSRTHAYGLRAKRAVRRARERVAAVVDASPDEVLFTSGATESNNIAILGLRAHAERAGRQHIVTTSIEHKAVLEPIEVLADRGFEVTMVSPGQSGAVQADAVAAAVRPDTLLVSVMHVNNETGIRQPIEQIASQLAESDAYFHVDAAQGFGKDLVPLRHPRIDLISISSHKIYGPVGVGGLVARRRGFDRPPLGALAFGGGQERGLRPGTLPVPLVVALGVAAHSARVDAHQRAVRCAAIRAEAMAALAPLRIRVHGDPELALPHVLSFSVPGIDSEALMLSLKPLVAVSNGSACTSQTYTPSHVLAAMDMGSEAVSGAVRMSWCHLTPQVDWSGVAGRIASLG